VKTKSREHIIRSLSPYYTLEERTTSETQEAGQLAHEAVAAGVDIVIACGGDGIISQAASALVHTRVALGIIPLGTTNALSHVLWGIRSKLEPIENGAKTKIARLSPASCSVLISILLAVRSFI